MSEGKGHDCQQPASAHFCLSGSVRATRTKAKQMTVGPAQSFSFFQVGDFSQLFSLSLPRELLFIT